MGPWGRRSLPWRWTNNTDTGGQKASRVCVLCLVKGRIGKIDVLLIHFFLGQAYRLAKALEVYHLAGPQELDDIADIRVVAEPQDIVIRHAGLLFRSHILCQVRYDIPLHADPGGVPGSPGGGGGIDTRGVVHKVGGKATGTELFLGEIAGQLVYNGADHLQMSQLFRTYRGTKMAPKAQNLCAATDSGYLSSAEYN